MRALRTLRHENTEARVRTCIVKNDRAKVWTCDVWSTFDHYEESAHLLMVSGDHCLVQLSGDVP